MYHCDAQTSSLGHALKITHFGDVTSFVCFCWIYSLFCGQCCIFPYDTHLCWKGAWTLKVNTQWQLHLRNLSIMNAVIYTVLWFVLLGLTKDNTLLRILVCKSCSCFIYEFENTDICSVSFTLDLTFPFDQKLQVLISICFFNHCTGSLLSILSIPLKGYKATPKCQNPFTMHVSLYTMSYHAIDLCVYKV